MRKHACRSSAAVFRSRCICVGRASALPALLEALTLDALCYRRARGTDTQRHGAAVVETDAERPMGASSTRASQWERRRNPPALLRSFGIGETRSRLARLFPWFHKWELASLGEWI
ncbi:hypothetical protein ISCGN_016526 [Ixodes scapularis]